MKKTTIILSLALAAALPLHAQQSGIIARVADEDVTVATLAPFFEDLTERDRQALEDNPTLLNQTVRNVIMRRLLMKEALASGFDKKPEVEERMERARETVILEAYVREITRPPADFPTKEQIAELYEATKGELIVPEQLELAQIYIPMPRDADKVQEAAAKTLADQVQKRLAQAGTDFLEVAAAVSAEGPVRGGEVGWVALDNLQPEVKAAVAKLDKGAVTPALQLADGYYFVKVLDRRAQRTPPLDEVSAQLADVLREQRARQNFEAYLARLQQQHPVSINELSLSEVLKQPLR